MYVAYDRIRERVYVKLPLAKTELEARREVAALMRYHPHWGSRMSVAWVEERPRVMVVS